ncbi:MAG: hypothetical protein V5A31_10215 [Haloferacaceae archaeon]
MTSTVLDAALCLLLVSASVGTLATVTPEEPPDRHTAADADAETLATATATVNYTLAPGARRAAGTTVSFPDASGPEFARTAHGSLAGLLADAALGRVAVGGERITHARADLVAGVRSAVEAAVGGANTQVVADWQPYAGAPVGGRVTVGDGPPPAADVNAARVAVGRGESVGEARVERAAARGYGPLATLLADRTVATLLPPEAMRFALGADYPVSALVRHRYRRVADLTGVELGELSRERVGTANARIERALAGRFERDLRARHDSPTAAARTVRVGEVRVVVRRWSA